MVQEYDPEQSPYSYGTTPIYNTLFKILTKRDDDTDIIAINLSTMIRNAASKSKLQDRYKEAKEKALPFDQLAADIVNETTQETKLLVNDIVEMLNSKASPLPRYIYVYFADYSNIIPKAYSRIIPAGKQHLDMAEERLKTIYKHNRTENNVNGIRLIELYDSSSHTAPYHWLEKEIKSIKNQHNMIMISSHPLDYHVARYVGRWTDIKSFNGSTQTFKDLGNKVFGHSFLPFTEKLHVLLGDKIDIKAAITPSNKKKLLEIAERDSWHLKSKDYVDRVLSQLNFITPYAI